MPRKNPWVIVGGGGQGLLVERRGTWSGMSGGNTWNGRMACGSDILSGFGGGEVEKGVTAILGGFALRQESCHKMWI